MDVDRGRRGTQEQKNKENFIYLFSHCHHFVRLWQTTDANINPINPAMAGLTDADLEQRLAPVVPSYR